MDISLFDYNLPEDLIAYYPARQRDWSRLMVVDRSTGKIENLKFTQISDFMTEGDGLVINDTRVFKARLQMRRQSGGKVEIFLLHEVESDEKSCWKILSHPTRRIKEGENIFFGDDGYLTVEEKLDQGYSIISFKSRKEAFRLIDKYGSVPLPVYIHRKAEKRDENRYQTIYSDPDKNKSVAAPTAGLHFTNRVIKKLKDRGIKIIPVTLHVGYGTFKPVKTDNIEEHTVDAEYAEIGKSAANSINKIRKAGGKIFAVGSTSTRTLESAEVVDGKVQPFHGFVDLYIKPGYQFKVVDHMITNFHLPKSSLMFLVAAFAGRDLILKAYNMAVKGKYRFYSYGDCMLIK